MKRHGRAWGQSHAPIEGALGSMNMIDILIAAVTLATCMFSYVALERIEQTR